MSDNVNERQKREKIISGEATTRKKTGIAKMSDIFVAEDIQTVKTRMFMDVLVPSLKDVIANVIISGVQMILFGDSGRRNRAPGARYDYGGYYNSLNQQQKTQKADYSYGYNDPVVNSRGDAERILQEMAEIIGEYGKASIADLYDLKRRIRYDSIFKNHMPSDYCNFHHPCDGLFFYLCVYYTY